MSDLEQGVSGLLRTHDAELSRFFDEIKVRVQVGDTKASAHCYVLKLDGNGVPPLDDLAAFLAANAVDFAMSRSKIAEATTSDATNRTTSKVGALHKQARALFKSRGTSGESGELLLYLMVQGFLKLPQLLSKMSLKTNSEMHVHGTDGIHISVENDANNEPILCLYWCESKLHKSPNDAIGECVKSLSEYLLVEGGAERRERDLQLAHDHLGESVADKTLEDALVRYLKKDNPLANRVNYRGIGLVGFDSAHYPTVQNTGSVQTVKEATVVELESWLDKVHKEIRNQKIETIIMHLFILPLPSVEIFREKVSRALER